MVFIDGGTLSAAWCRITVASFSIGKYPVTFAQWKETRKWSVEYGYDIGKFGSGSANDHPVHSVTWFDTIKWCNAQSEKECLVPVYTVGAEVYRRNVGCSDVTFNPSANGYRLPTQVEWAFAAHGGLNSKKFMFSGGDVLDEVGWYSGNSNKHTHPVGCKKANELGLYDMSGNVREYCFDWHPGYEGSYRVGRGGSCYMDEEQCLLRWQDNTVSPCQERKGVGFRVARNAPGV
jgi:sulfatase modifying factor 1